MRTLAFRQRWSLPHYFDPGGIQTGKMDFDMDKCTTCGKCRRACPVGSIIVPKYSERHGSPTRILEPLPDMFMCFACTNCVTVCPVDAIAPARRYTAHSYFNRLFRLPEMTPPRRY